MRVDAFLLQLEEHRDTHLLDSIDQYFANLTSADELTLRKIKLWSLTPPSELLLQPINNIYSVSGSFTNNDYGNNIDNNGLGNPVVDTTGRNEVKGILAKPSAENNDKKSSKKSKKLTINES